MSIKKRISQVLFSVFFLLAIAAGVLFYGQTVSHHPVQPAGLGVERSTADMERLIDTPGPVELQTFTHADWSVSLEGLVNLNRPQAAELSDRDEPIQIYSHLLKHPEKGYFLVDSGLSRQFAEAPGNFGTGKIIVSAMKLERLQLKISTAEVLKGLDSPLKGVFITHLHLDHIFGLPDIPTATPIYVGKDEVALRNYKHYVTQPVTDGLLLGRPPLQEWQFTAESAQPFAGIIDVFGDGSLFAIGAPGHTAGSTAYLVRTIQGPVLLTGDVCHTRWGWDNGVEPGKFTHDHDLNLASLQHLKGLVARHPSILVKLGHQL